MFRNLTRKLEGEEDKLAASASLKRRPVGSAVEEKDLLSIIEDPDPDWYTRDDVGSIELSAPTKDDERLVFLSKLTTKTATTNSE